MKDKWGVWWNVTNHFEKLNGRPELHFTSSLDCKKEASRETQNCSYLRILENKNSYTNCVGASSYFLANLVFTGEFFPWMTSTKYGKLQENIVQPAAVELFWSFIKLCFEWERDR